MARLGIAVAVTTVALLAVAQAIDFGAFDLRLSWLNADQRLSVFAIFSLLAQAATALVGAIRGAIATNRRAAWLALAVLLGALVPLRGLTRFNASVLAVPLACVFLLLFLLTWNNVRSRQMMWAALLLLAASLLLHKVGPDADSATVSDYTWTYQWVGIVKHGAELAGWILAATAITAGVARPAPPTAATSRPSELEPLQRSGRAAKLSPRSD